MSDKWTRRLRDPDREVAYPLGGREVPSAGIRRIPTNITEQPPFEDCLPQKGSIRFVLREHGNHFAAVDGHECPEGLLREFCGNPTDRSVKHAYVGSKVAHPTATRILVDV